jgi:hypothetical protein
VSGPYRISLYKRLKDFDVATCRRVRAYFDPLIAGSWFDASSFVEAAELPPGLGVAIMDVLAIDKHLDLFFVTEHKDGELRCEAMAPWAEGLPQRPYVCPTCKNPVSVSEDSRDEVRFNIRGVLRHRVLILLRWEAFE